MNVYLALLGQVGLCVPTYRILRVADSYEGAKQAIREYMQKNGTERWQHDTPDDEEEENVVLDCWSPVGQKATRGSTFLNIQRAELHSGSSPEVELERLQLV